ncbi:MAG TPA: hypothetical protein DDW30_08020 [Clostridiales bacterium]|nr:hypothetical protein [Clostridiales bacterium]
MGAVGGPAGDAQHARRVLHALAADVTMVQNQLVPPVAERRNRPLDFIHPRAPERLVSHQDLLATAWLVKFLRPSALVPLQLQQVQTKLIPRQKLPRLGFPRVISLRLCHIAPSSLMLRKPEPFRTAAFRFSVPSSLAFSIESPLKIILFPPFLIFLLTFSHLSCILYVYDDIISHFRSIVKYLFKISEISALCPKRKVEHCQNTGRFSLSVARRNNMEYARLEQLLAANHVTVYQVAKATGISASTFSDWKSGRSTPKADKLARIADYFGIGLDELLGTDSGERRTASSLRSLRAQKMVPVIGVIRAGTPIVTNETLLGMEFADVDDPEDYFYLEVCGDSMRDCGIVDGTYVLFRKQQYAENGDIVACLVDGDSATVKRFEKRNRRIVLSPENDDYDPIILTPEDFETGRSRILGVAVEAKTKF